MNPIILVIGLVCKDAGNISIGTHTQDSLSVVHLIRSVENETEPSSKGFLLRFGEVKSIQPNDLVIVLQGEKQVRTSTED